MKNLLINIFITFCIFSIFSDKEKSSVIVEATMVYVGIATTVVGAGTSLYGASKNAKASKNSLAQQSAQANQSYSLQKGWMDYFKEAIGAFSEQAFALAGESKDEIKGSYGRSNKIIDAIPEVKFLIEEGKELSRDDFDFRTGIKRENLDFITGDTQDKLRDAQKLNASIAGLDSSDFMGKFSDIVKSSMFGLKADTVGDPYGTFANLSARNLYDFSQQGLSNTLAINDFFSKEGTVDPISPLQTAFDLRTVAEREAGMKVQNEQWRANSIASVNSGLMGALGSSLGATGNAAQMGIGLESNNLANLSNISNAGLVAQQAQTQAYVNAIGQLSSGIGQAYGLQTQRIAANNQGALNDKLINQYTGNQFLSERYSTPRNVSERYPGT